MIYQVLKSSHLTPILKPGRWKDLSIYPLSSSVHSSCLDYRMNGTLAIEWCDADVMQAIKKLLYKSGKPDLLRSNVRYSTSVGRLKVVNLLARQIKRRREASIRTLCLPKCMLFQNHAKKAWFCLNNATVERSSVHKAIQSFKYTVTSWHGNSFPKWNQIAQNMSHKPSYVPCTTPKMMNMYLKVVLLI